MIYRPIVKTHGGKYYLHRWVIDNFYKDYHDMQFVEMFVGGGSVFMNKPVTNTEIICDKDFSLIAIWKSIQNNLTDFTNRLLSFPYNEQNFLWFKENESSIIELGSELDIAVCEYSLRRMSRGGMRKAFAWSNRLRGGKPGDQNAWETAIASLPIVHKRIKDTKIHHFDFRETFEFYDNENTMFYLDPPYLHETRSENSRDVYIHEMSFDDHLDMLYLCNKSNSKILISGYDNDIYRKNLKGWSMEFKDIANHSSQSKSKERKTECLWRNY